MLRPLLELSDSVMSPSEPKALVEIVGFRRAPLFGVRIDDGSQRELLSMRELRRHERL